ncbi:MAG: peptidylprolyl isomerase [Pirellulales bacterium]
MGIRRSRAGFVLAAACLWSAGCGSSDKVATEKGAQAPDSATAGTKTPAEDLLHPKVLIKTSLGEITVKLDAEKVPLTVDNFLSYVKAGHYDNTIFHQVDDGYAILGGGYTADLVQKPVRTSIRNDAHNAMKNRRGTIAMTRAADVIDSSQAEFFINLVDNPALDYKGRTAAEYGYCVFGEVVGGLDVVDRIGKVKVHDSKQFEKIPVETVLIQSIRCVP